MKRVFVFIFLTISLLAGGLEGFTKLVLKDKNGDGVLDSSNYCLIFKENDLSQVALAAEIAYRLGFEAGEYVDLLGRGKRKIVIRYNENLPPGVGVVKLKGKDIYFEGKDKDGLMATREFLWRFPYVWKTSKFVGKTWENVKQEIENIFKNKNIKVNLELIEVRLRGMTAPYKSTYLEKGEVAEAIFRVKSGSLRKIKVFLENLERERTQGRDAFTLNYPYIEKLSFVDRAGRKVSMKRWGAPEEFFRPSYGIFPKARVKRTPPPISKLFATPVAVILEKGAGKGAVAFAFRAGLEAKEARFPLIYFDEKYIPEDRSIVVIGKGKLSEKHMLSEETRNFCFEKGKKFWFLKPECAEEFSSTFLFPALTKEKNLFYLRFFLEKLRFWIPAEAQRILAKEAPGEPFISGEIYGKKLVYKKVLNGPDEVQRLKNIIKGVKYTKLVAYVSETPERRKALEKELGPAAKIRSAYKTGFFWITEEVIPRIKDADRIVIHVRRVKPGRLEEITSSPKQFLYELYPVDEIINKRTGIPVDKIEFKMEEAGPLYVVEAYRKGKLTGKFSLNPPILWTPFPRVEGWVFAKNGEKPVISRRLKTDPELAWEFYRGEFLPWLKKFILEKTDNNPIWNKQPFFSFIEINFDAPEPDFPLGLDYEMVSSTEALHDELYFYTLYFVSRLLKPAKKGGSLRWNLYPGAIIPLIRTSKKGFRFEVKVFDYRKPGVYRKKKAVAKFYPSGKVKYEIMGWEKGRLWVELKFDKEDDFILYSRAFSRIKETKFPEELVLTLRYKDTEKTYRVHGKLSAINCKGKIKSWDQPLSPEKAECLASQFKYSYPIAESFKGRRVYIIEKVSATGPRYSALHFVREKPTIVFNARQHANEVSSTSYLLRFLLGEKVSKEINLIANPVENPDGTAIAIMMMRRENPLHSLHAGRYNALGTDLGFHLKEFSPYAPVGFARLKVLNRWKPDIFLNLHGYPSHEWVHQFTGYLPFPYRNYWIPRGHFFYFSSSENPVHEKYSRKSMDVLDFVTKYLSSDRKINDFNKRLYDRYTRWARRWNPHAFKMVYKNNYNVYWKSGRSISFKVSPDSTFASEVPEYMDETARGKLLKYLMHCGDQYIKAHVKYLLTHRQKPFYVFQEGRTEIKLNKLRKRW